MRLRRLLAFAAWLAGSALGAVLLRRRMARGRERVELYFEDGSLVSLTEGSPDAELLLFHARELLAGARA
jgi:hypothetical protein